jgi:predicted DCC family thiol-disulfide oxidoreductase YuxK
MGRRPSLLYDADCRFCRFVARVCVRLDRHDRVAYLPLQDGEARRLLADLTDAQRMASIHLVETDGRRASAGAALAGMLGHLGVPRRPAWLVGLLYGPVARARGVIGRLFPDGPAPGRND